MKPMPELDALLSRARASACSGPRSARSSTLPIAEGIAAIVKQQFEVAQQVLAAGLIPMIEPEINIKSPERAEADQILLEELQKALDALPATTR
jgi:fructose-bisphosphate aldolase class I